MGITRLAFPNALEGDCLPSGEYAVATRSGPILTDLGELPGPPGDQVRYVTLTMVGGRKMAGQGQDDSRRATWEWVNGEWFDRGPNTGERPCIYDQSGQLIIARPEPNQVVEGWTYGMGGSVVKVTRFDPSVDLHEFTWAWPYLIGQSSIDGIDLLDGSTRLQVEPGDVHTIWSRFRAGVLAVATRKLTQNETVLIWVPEGEVAGLPKAPRTPVVEPKPKPKPDPDPKPKPDPKDEPVQELNFPFDFNPTGRLEALRSGFPTPLGARHAEFLVRACKVVGFGAGLLKKDGGTHITLPNGVNVSQDWMVFPATATTLSVGTDFLSDGENAAGVGWGEAQANPGTLVDVSGLFVGPDPDPDPKPDDPTLTTRVTTLEAALKVVIQQLRDAEDLARAQARQITALEARPMGGELPADVARKGDPVTVKGTLDLRFYKQDVVGHGSIDK